jgi:hemerythrin-like domain-containing protein
MEVFVEESRRKFIRSSLLVLASSTVNEVIPSISLADQKNKSKVGVEEVSPVEDLMREHGGLNRILLIYDEGLRRLRGKEDFDVALVGRSAKLIHDFIEGYHEKLEEEHLFPRLKEAGKLVSLVETLTKQHRAGRHLTESIIGLSKAARIKVEIDRSKLENSLTQFMTMYRPHEAREDTILFPAFKEVVTPKEYDKLGDQFEDREHELFGKEGFEGVIVQIAEIEKALGIFDLDKFTPQ